MVVDEIFDERSKLDINDKKQEREALKRKASKICDAISLLGDNAHANIKNRRENMKFAIPDVTLRKRLLKVPNHKEGVPNQYLYGDDLGEQMKSADEARRVMNKIKPRKDYSNDREDYYKKSQSKNYGGRHNKGRYKNQDKNKGDYKGSRMDHRSPLGNLYDKTANHKSYKDKPHRQ